MSSRDKSLISVIVLILIAVGGYFLVVQPEHHKANQVQAQIGSKQTDLSQAESQVQAGQSAEAQYRTYARQLKAITAAVPTDQQIPGLINELQTASTKNKVDFQEVSTAGAGSATPAATSSTSSNTTGTSAAPFPSQDFTLQFTGGYFAVSDLLGTLDSFVRADNKHFKASGRLISISTVALSPGTSGTASSSAASGDVTASVTASDYDIPTALLSGSSSTSTG